MKSNIFNRSKEVTLPIKPKMKIKYGDIKRLIGIGKSGSHIIDIKSDHNCNFNIEYLSNFLAHIIFNEQSSLNSMSYLSLFGYHLSKSNIY